MCSLLNIITCFVQVRPQTTWEYHLQDTFKTIVPPEYSSVPVVQVKSFPLYFLKGWNCNRLSVTVRPLSSMMSLLVEFLVTSSSLLINQRITDICVRRLIKQRIVVRSFSTNSISLSKHMPISVMKNCCEKSILGQHSWHFGTCCQSRN